MDSSPRPRLAAGTPKRKHEALSAGNDDIDSNGRHSSGHPVLAKDFPAGPAFRPIFPALNLLAPAAVSVDGSRSPPSHMAHRFRSLAIKEDGRDDVGVLGVSAAEKSSEDDTEPPKAKRRLIKLTSRKNAISVMSPPSAFGSESDNAGGISLEATLNNDSESSGSSSRRSTPSPPTSRIIIDPLRASLTWQDDEITIYDPNDDDDDGTGVNGIGFKPTPAVARARARRRRQQMTEYRRREEREARARRNLQRRSRVVAVGKGLVLEATAAAAVSTAEAEAAAGGPGATTASAATKPSTARHVRFIEGPATIRFLEPEAILG